MKTAARVLAGLSLAACLALPLARFWGGLDDAPFKMWLAIASLGWFVFAIGGMERRPRS